MFIGHPIEERPTYIGEISVNVLLIPIVIEGPVEIPDWLGYFILGFVCSVLFCMIRGMNRD